MFKENLGLTDSISTIWEWKGQNRPEMAFSFPKCNQQQMQAYDINTSDIIPHIIMFKENLGLNDSISTIWEQKDQNSLKCNQQQMQV